MTFKTIATNTSVAFPGITLDGSIEHDDDQRALVMFTAEGPETLSVNLQAYGLLAPSGHVWIKDWSEHEGLAASLAASGLVDEVSDTFVGPFFSRAVLVRVLGS